MARDGQFLTAQQLGDGERQMVPPGIATLPVRGDGIVYHRFHTVLSQVTLQFITPFRENRKDMADRVMVATGYAHKTALHLINI